MIGVTVWSLYNRYNRAWVSARSAINWPTTQRPPMTSGADGRITSSSSSSLSSALRMCCRVAYAGSFFPLRGIIPTFSEEKVEPSNANATFLATCRAALPRRRKLLLVPSLSTLQENTCKGIPRTKVRACWVDRTKHSGKSNLRPSWLVADQVTVKFRIASKFSTSDALNKRI